MLLPTVKGATVSTTERSIHQGRHLEGVSKYLAKEMDFALEQGAAAGWTQAQYEEALIKIIHAERAALKSGIRNLSKHTRPNGVPLP